MIEKATAGRPGSTGGALVQAIAPGSNAPRFVFPAMLIDRKALGDGLTLAEYVNVYATTRPLAPETIRQYRIAVSRFEEWAGAGVRLRELSELMVSHWLRYLEGRVKPSTARSKRVQILSLWRGAASEYLCDPPTRAVRATRVPWEPRECWTREEVSKLIREASWAPRRHSCGLRRADWWELAIRIGWDTGLRWGDQMRLRVDEMIEGLAVVRQRKTSGPVAVRLHPSTRALLEWSLTEAPRELVTPWDASQETFAKQLRLLVAKAGITPGTWRFLRRGGATNIEGQAPNRGMAARHLGHAPGSKIAELNYINPRVGAMASPSIMPDEL